MHVLYRLNPMIFGGPLVHLFIVLTFRQTIQSFLDELETLYRILGCPRLPCVRRSCIVAIQWIFFVVFDCVNRL